MEQSGLIFLWEYSSKAGISTTFQQLNGREVGFEQLGLVTTHLKYVVTWTITWLLETWHVTRQNTLDWLLLGLARLPLYAGWVCRLATCLALLFCRLLFRIRPVSSIFQSRSERRISAHLLLRSWETLVSVSLLIGTLSVSLFYWHSLSFTFLLALFQFHFLIGLRGLDSAVWMDCMYFSV